MFQSHNAMNDLAGNSLILSQCHKPLSKFYQWEVQIMKITNPTYGFMQNINVLHCTY